MNSEDEDAYADYMESDIGIPVGFLAIRYDGATASFAITFQTGGPVSFAPSEEPFEIRAAGPVELKDSEGECTYRLNKIRM